MAASLSHDEVDRCPVDDEASTDVKHPERDEEKSLPLDDQEVEMPYGVHQIEAVTMVWSRWQLAIAYVGVYILMFWVSVQYYATSSLTAYTISAFSAHSLISTTTMVCFIIAGVVQVPIAKVLDIWGRLEGLIAMIFFMDLGLVMLAACKNVQTYAAANVFYEIGFSGISYVLTVFIVDTSRPKNRALMIGLTNVPVIATTFAGSPMGQAFYDHSTWRWAYGTFAIVLPFIALPFILPVWLNQWKSRKASVIKTPRSNRSAWQSILYYCLEFDVIGVILFGAGLTIFLLPFTLAASAYKEWRSAGEITMIVLGFLLLVAFVAYEKFFCPKPFVSFSLLKDRTVLGACLVNIASGASYFIWDSYYSSYLMVVHGQSITNAGYIASIYWEGVAIAGVISGVFLRQTSNFKILGVSAIALSMLGTGLMIKFRQPDTKIGYVVMCQILIAAAGGMLTIAQYMALLSPSSGHGKGSVPSVAILLSLSSLFSKIGAAIGLCISGGIWTNQFGESLRRRLPDALKSTAASIYGSIVYQLLGVAQDGSPTQIAIYGAYGEMQRKFTITATCVLVLCFVGIAMWRNVKPAAESNEKKGVTV